MPLPLLMSPKLYDIIKNMYKHTEVAVNQSGNLSNYVDIERGVKQGDSSSPNLFNIYSNDFNTRNI